MATRIYKGSPGNTLADITDGVGAATASKVVELTVDLATTTVTDGSTTRQITKFEVLLILELFEMYITAGNWPPA